jgi:hypothetical protein
MEIEDIIILILTILIIFFIFDRKRENFESESGSVIKESELEGFKLMRVPNFYEVFGSINLNKTFEFPGVNNWKLFTNTKLIENEGLASLICSDNPPFYNIYDKFPQDKNIRMTGFSIRNNNNKNFETSVVIGIMTPIFDKPYNSGQWLKGFEWFGYSKLDDDKKNARDIVIWANRNQSTNIEFNDAGEIKGADKLLEITIPQQATSTGPISFIIDNYNYTKRKKEISPYTTYYFQILNNWDDPNTVKVSAIVPHFEI